MTKIYVIVNLKIQENSAGIAIIADTLYCNVIISPFSLYFDVDVRAKRLIAVQTRRNQSPITSHMQDAANGDIYSLTAICFTVQSRCYFMLFR
jgi:hypothetical protein